jgi:hypothetical protein
MAMKAHGSCAPAPKAHLKYSKALPGYGGIILSMSGVENRRSGGSLPVAIDEAFAASPQSGLA